MPSLILRVRYPEGTSKIENIDPKLTISELRKTIENSIGIPSSKQILKFGFPPKEVTNSSITLEALGIKSNETLIVELGEVKETLSTDIVSNNAISIDFNSNIHKSVDKDINTGTMKKLTPDSFKGQVPAKPYDVDSSTVFQDGYIFRRKIDADNSCLFNALAYVLEGHQSRKLKRASGLRQVVAEIVKLNKDEIYDSAFLGQAPMDYCRWIVNPNNWGGGIELSIFSDFYELEIAAFDIKSSRMDCYGSDKHYKTRVYLIYDGIHYDALSFNFLEHNAPEDMDVTVFSAKDKNVELMMLNFVKKACARHEFTDINDFKLKCSDCNKKLRGSKEAADHFKAT